MIDNGNISTKTNMGLYSYNDTYKPHAVDYIEACSEVQDDYQYIDYNVWNKVEEIYYSDGDDGYTYEIEYGPDGQRVMSRMYKNGSLYCRKFYWGEYEEIYFYSNSETVRTYWVDAPDGLAGMFWTSTSDYYTVVHPNVAMTDHLGSLTGLYDYDGNKVFDASYDAWGKRTLSPNSFTFIARGYTGHEHLDELGLINMNGRMYDPRQGRFLSPDPFVQAPSNPQNYNRYSYCLNNPLKYTDPSGEIIWAPILFAAAMGGVQGTMLGLQNGAEGWGLVGYIAGGALIGGLSGYGASVLSAAGLGACGVASITGTFNGAMFNCLANGFTSNNFFKGALSGALSGSLGGAVGSMIGGGWGAFTGGSVSNLTNQVVTQALYYNPEDPNHNEIKINWKSVLTGGLSSLGSYHALSYYYYLKGGNQLNGHSISYKQYCTMNADFQRSRILKKEFGGWLMEDGNVIRWPSQNRYSLSVDPTEEIPEGAFASYHTHWAKPGDRYYVINRRIVEKLHPSDFRYNNTPECVRYHSDLDLEYHSIWGIDSYVINRYDYSFSSSGGTPIVGNNVFLRYFLFGY